MPHFLLLNAVALTDRRAVRYRPHRGHAMYFRWEPGFEISVTVEEDGAVLVSANRAGLVSLANHLATLAQGEHTDHFHLDEYNSLEEGSAELIVALTS